MPAPNSKGSVFFLHDWPHPVGGTGSLGRGCMRGSSSRAIAEIRSRDKFAARSLRRRSALDPRVPVRKEPDGFGSQIHTCRYQIPRLSARFKLCPMIVGGSLRDQAAMGTMRPDAVNLDRPSGVRVYVRDLKVCRLRAWHRAAQPLRDESPCRPPVGSGHTARTWAFVASRDGVVQHLERLGRCPDRGYSRLTALPNLVGRISEPDMVSPVERWACIEQTQRGDKPGRGIQTLFLFRDS